jgi:hypothetical protein
LIDLGKKPEPERHKYYIIPGISLGWSIQELRPE